MTLSQRLSSFPRSYQVFVAFSYLAPFSFRALPFARHHRHDIAATTWHLGDHSDCGHDRRLLCVNPKGRSLKSSGSPRFMDRGMRAQERRRWDWLLVARFSRDIYQLTQSFNI